MGSKQGTVDYVLDQLSQLDGVVAKKMFGEYAVYYDGKMAVLVCDDNLFVKPTDAGRAYIGVPAEAQPYPQAKPWFLIDGDQLEDRAWLCELVRITAAALPVPAPKKPKAPKKIT
ncbi:MAG TPA: TfoX/Sxy family protein [Burkholderiaceae bacterium]